MSEQTTSQPIIVKKVRKGGEGHHGGSWKVAFADFMTAMMAFFLVMWIIGLDQETRSAIAGYFQDPLDFAKKSSGNRLENLLEHGAPGYDDKKQREGEAKDSEINEMSAIAQEIKQALKTASDQNPQLEDLSKYVKIEGTEEGLLLEFLESLGSVFFDTGSAQLKPEAKQLFAVVAKVLTKHDRPFVVDGHTDARPYKQTGYNNIYLSQDRARSVVLEMLRLGVPENRILAVRGFGPHRLRNKQDPYHFTNRRVTILLPYSWEQSSVLGSSGDGPLSEPFSKPVDIRAPSEQKP
ncbi:MAG: flagellar motor protein MotB [Fimbriimonadales bacterium]|nr:MAG: flagellar motor protein MotB [Fimbriimonadales bacterium]